MGKKNTDVKAVIFEIIKTKFSKSSFWKAIEPDIGIFCSDIVDPTTPEKTKQFIKQINQIRDFFLGHEVQSDELIFLENEIEKCEKTKTISLYEEEDDEINPEDIEYYSRHGGATEGIVGIHLPLNYTQLGKLTNGVFKKTGLIKFYISREKTICGKIIAEIYEHAQEIPIATLVESRKKNKETGEPEFRGINLFGHKFIGTQFKNVKEVNLPFYIYRFITDKNKEMILFSTSFCEIGDYVITGMETKCEDYKVLTDTTKLPTKLPFFFSQTVMNRIIKFKNHAELKEKLNIFEFKNGDFCDYPFTVKKQNKLYKLLQPDWYKLLIWAWLTHQPKGLFNNYPMHLMIVGEKCSGKSSLLNSLHEKSREARSIFSGSQSTLKYLVPSFKYAPAKLGYLVESNRFAFCDEFFRCLYNTRTTKEGSQREESVAMMNDLLEHQKREAGSGISRVNINMTSRIIATTNPIRNIKSITDLINSFDESFLSRWMIYNQTPDHVSMVRDSDDSDLEVFEHNISSHDWIAVLDYLHSFSSEYDMKKVKEIYESVPRVLSETLNRHYDARHKHHLECLIDGIIKTRCILDGDMSFKANEKDYENLKIVWLKLITSWIDLKGIRYLDIKDRIFYMPEKCQSLYWAVAEFKKPMERTKVKELALKMMNKNEFYEAWAALIDNGLIKESNGIARTYFMREMSETNGLYVKQGED